MIQNMLEPQAKDSLLLVSEVKLEKEEYCILICASKRCELDGNLDVT